MAIAMIAKAQTATQGPGIIAIGSPLIWSPTNAPDTFTANTTFSSTPVTVDNGAVTIWQQQVPTGSNGEWDIFWMKTTSGGPIAGNINANWNLTMNYTLTAPVIFDHSFIQWMVNGVPVSPLTNGIGSICCATTSTPISNILPGPAYYNTDDVQIPAGVYSNWQQVYVDPYNLVANGGINGSAANEIVFALHFTLQNAPPAITQVISASQFGAFPAIAPGSWIEIYGSNLANLTQLWASSNFSGPNNAYAPTVLSSTSVTIGGIPAYTEYVSPTQVNVQVPAGVGMGSQPLVVTTEVGSSAPFNVTVNATEPGLLAPSTFDLGGTQYVTAQLPDGTYVLPPGAISGVTSKPASPGDVITIYGVGFGAVSQGVPPGQVAEGSTSLSLPIAVSIGGAPATVNYAGLAPDYVGLYQINVVVPNISATGAVRLTFTLWGASGSQPLSVAVQ